MTKVCVIIKNEMIVVYIWGLEKNYCLIDMEWGYLDNRRLKNIILSKTDE